MDIEYKIYENKIQESVMLQGKQQGFLISNLN